MSSSWLAHMVAFLGASVLPTLITLHVYARAGGYVIRAGVIYIFTRKMFFPLWGERTHSLKLF